MEALQEIWFRAIEQLFERPHGPLNFRFVIMPLTVTLIAIRSGIKNGRAGKGGFVWALFYSSKEERQILFQSAVKDLSRVFIVAMVLDTIYQVMVFRAFYIVQALIVAVVCAVLPYLIVRGPVTLLVHMIIKKKGVPDSDGRE